MSDPGILAASLLQKYFPKFGSFRKYVTYQSYPQATYSPTTGLVTEGTPTAKNLYVIFSKAGSSNRSGIVQFSDNDATLDIDSVVLFPSLDLGTIVPKIGDVIVQGDTKWVVVTLDYDPMPAHYSLLCRAV